MEMARLKLHTAPSKLDRKGNAGRVSKMTRSSQVGTEISNLVLVLDTTNTCIWFGVEFGVWFRVEFGVKFFPVENLNIK